MENTGMLVLKHFFRKTKVTEDINKPYFHHKTLFPTWFINHGPVYLKTNLSSNCDVFVEETNVLNSNSRYAHARLSESRELSSFRNKRTSTDTPNNNVVNDYNIDVANNSNKYFHTEMQIIPRKSLIEKKTPD